jgi:hypothetical protein
MDLSLVLAKESVAFLLDDCFVLRSRRVNASYPAITVGPAIVDPPTRFVNVHHWSDLKVRPLDLMKKYFDARLYVRNLRPCHFG